MTCPATRARPLAGFTILELLAVMGILAVLMGVGFGFLQRGSTDLDLAETIVRDQARLCSVTARTAGLPTELVVLPADDGAQVALQARVLRPVGHWHFEPGETWVDARLRPELAGAEEPAGRFGRAWRAPDNATLLAVRSGGNDAFDLTSGFALRLDVKLEQRAAATVAQLGRAFELRLTEDLVPQGRLTLAESGGRPGLVATVAGSRALPLQKWVALELIHDGRALALSVDGREVARAAAAGAPFQTASDVFEISTGNAPLAGLVDEVRLLAYDRGERLELPVDIELTGWQGAIEFDRLGMPRGHVQLMLSRQGESRTRVIGPGGVLQ
jgi:hypothetical protein